MGCSSSINILTIPCLQADKDRSSLVCRKKGNKRQLKSAKCVYSSYIITPAGFNNIGSAVLFIARILEVLYFIEIFFNAVQIKYY